MSFSLGLIAQFTVVSDFWRHIILAVAGILFVVSAIGFLMSENRERESAQNIEVIAPKQSGNITTAGRDVIYHSAQEPAETHQQKQQRILLKIIDLVSQFGTYGPSSAGYAKRTDPIAAFIKFHEEFQIEEDVLEMCRLFAASAPKRYDPFGPLEIRYPGQFKGRRLKFLRDARLSGQKIATESQALYYVDSCWSAANGFQGRPYSPPDP